MALFERSTKVVDDADLVAFVSDDTSRQALATYARNAGLASVMIAVGDMADAIRYLLQATRPPRQLVVDISRYDLPLSELNRLAEVSEPSIQVYAIGERNDVGLYRDLLGMGVMDYLVKPITADLARRLLSHEPHSGAAMSTARLRSGKVISLLGTRGGVGVTSIATHLSRTLLKGNARRRIAYIDLELHGGAAATQLGLPLVNTLGEVLRNSARVDPQYLERTLATADERLFLMSSQHEMGKEPQWPEHALTEIIGMLAQQFHYVVIDLPFTLGALAEEALAMSQVCTVVSDLSVHSSHRLDRLLPYVLTREPIPTVYLLLNQPQPESKGQVERRDFMQVVDQPVIQTLPYDARHLILAENLGEALPAGSPFQQGINRLAGMLSGGGAEADAPETSTPRWLRWIRRESPEGA